MLKIDNVEIPEKIYTLENFFPFLLANSVYYVALDIPSKHPKENVFWFRQDEPFHEKTWLWLHPLEVMEIKYIPYDRFEKLKAFI